MGKKIQLPIVNPDYEDGAPQEEAEASEESASNPSSSSGDGPKSRAEGGDILTEIEKEVTENRVMLYMKGSPSMPQCGFSARVAQILSHIGVENYGHANVLEDPEKRQGIKDYTDWPTIPQLYIDGEFVGGSDIVMQMFQNGELQEMLEK
jgi:monothiol glutaredoxin